MDMSKNKIKKLFKAHKDITDDGCVLSEAAAEKILSEQGCPTVSQIIERALAQEGVPEEVRAKLEALKRDVQDSGQSNNIKASASSRRAFSRHAFNRLAAACVLVCLIGAFFIFIPEGRAMAAQVYRAIISVFDNRLKIEAPVPTGLEITDSQNNSVRVRKFSSVEAFTDATGYTPYTLDPGEYVCNSINFTSDNHTGDTLYMQYSRNGGVVNTTQVWNLLTDMNSLADETFDQHVSDNGHIVYYTMDEKDKSYYGVTSLNNSILIIGADSSLTLDEYLKLFE